MPLSCIQVSRLTDTFARLAPNGVWEVPQWLCNMQQDLGLPLMQAFYVINWADHGFELNQEP